MGKPFLCAGRSFQERFLAFLCAGRSFQERFFAFLCADRSFQERFFAFFGPATFAAGERGAASPFDGETPSTLPRGDLPPHVFLPRPR